MARHLRAGPAEWDLQPVQAHGRLALGSQTHPEAGPRLPAPTASRAATSPPAWQPHFLPAAARPFTPHGVLIWRAWMMGPTSPPTARERGCLPQTAEG